MSLYGRTMVTDLPELNDLEAQGNNQYGAYDHQGFTNQPGMPEEKLQKYLRAPQQLNPYSGMGSPSQTNAGYGPPMGYSQHATLNVEPMQQQQVFEHMMAPPPEPQLNCIDVAKHIQGCPICSKFYQNDRSVYIIAIVVLSIVCLLLLKRVLNV